MAYKEGTTVISVGIKTKTLETIEKISKATGKSRTETINELLKGGLITTKQMWTVLLNDEMREALRKGAMESRKMDVINTIHTYEKNLVENPQSIEDTKKILDEIEDE